MLVSRLSLIVAVVGVLVQSAVLDLTVYACTTDGQARLECCCERESVPSRAPSVGIDARCCDVHDLSIDAQTFRAPSTDVLAPTFVAIVVDEPTVFESATRIDTSASARGPPGLAAPIYIQTCALLI